MATMPTAHIRIKVSLEPDDQTRAALIALGWTPPGKVRLGRLRRTLTRFAMILVLRLWPESHHV